MSGDWQAEQRIACEIDGHLTARRSHEQVWREPVPPWPAGVDFCLRCGEEDIVRAWPRWDRP